MSEPASPALNLNPRRERQPSTTSRPLSQISGTNLPFTPPNRETSWSGKPNSRPSSVANENDSADGRAAKRASVNLKMDEDKSAPPPTVGVISLNLNEYASTSARQAVATAATISDSTVSLGKPLVTPLRTSNLVDTDSELRSPITGQNVEGSGSESKVTDKEKAQTSEEPSEESMYKNARESLRPTGRRTSYAEVARIPPTSPIKSPTVRAYNGRPFDSPLPSAGESSTSISSVQPPPKARPGWLRRTTELPGMKRSQSKSPLLHDNTPLPPALPPRNPKEKSNSRGMPPPPIPSKTSYADVTAGPSRDSTDTQTSTGVPPRIPPRNTIGDRIAAFSRSASSASLASQASSPSAFSQQRLPNSAQRVLGSAGSAVSKGWAGIRARGVGGSLSSISQLGQSSRRGPSESGMPRSSRERHQTTQPVLSTLPEGPDFADAVLMRTGKGQPGTVFGRQLVEAGQDTHVMDANAGDEMEKRRRHCLPAIVVRCVEYLEIWGPKEEGIFRISGRSSHIARLKKEFDTGTDLDMRQCHPGDLDPHAVAGLFKSYLRELPSSILTPNLTPKFDAYAKRVQGNAPPSILSLADLDKNERHEPDELDDLLAQLPDANWFLLSDLVKLLDLIPRHVDTNRMTLHALMVSLGPSLKVGNGVLSELLKYRTQFFAQPPLRSGDTVTDLIDFGNVSIDPPSLAPVATVPLKEGQSSSISPSAEEPKVKKPPKLANKPSLTRLFSSSSRNLAQFTDPRPVTPASIDVEPPRVDLEIAETSPLPTFGNIPSPPLVDPNPPAAEASPVPNQSEPKTPSESEKQRMDDFHYPSGTVQARTQALTGTPIADLFSRKTTPQLPLRQSRDSVGSSSIRTSTSMSSVRRGQSAFFAGGSINTEKRSSHKSVPNTPADKDKRSSTQTQSSSVKEKIKEMENGKEKEKA